jgi:hypothetical protein
LSFITFQIKYDKVEETLITTDTDNQLGYCHVQKVASSSWMLLFAEMNHLDNNVIDDLLKKIALHGTLMTNFSIPVRNAKDIEDMNNSNLYKFIFIRHPFERLVSAFHDKFEYSKQGAMMLPFLKHEVIKYMMRSFKKQKSSKSSSLPFDIDISFKNFINFVLEEATYSVISEQSKHWWPYSDVCKMCKIKYDFIGSLETFKEDVSCMLKNFKNYPLLQKMEDRVKNKINAGSEHTTSMTMEYFSKLSKKTIQMLYELYKVDFILGNYKFPKAYIDIGIP